jgi:hypothetical protein
MTEQPLKLVGELNALVERAQHVLADYLPEDSGMSDHEAINRLFDVLDGPEQRRIQKQARKLLRQAGPAFFTEAE